MARRWRGIGFRLQQVDVARMADAWHAIQHRAQILYLHDESFVQPRTFFF